MRPEGRLARDSGVVRLFVEFSLLDLPTEETPMSLPKPRPGRSINFNYSKGMCRMDISWDVEKTCGFNVNHHKCLNKIKFFDKQRGAGCDSVVSFVAVVPLDGEEHSARRRLLRETLQGRNPQMEK